MRLRTVVVLALLLSGAGCVTVRGTTAPGVALTRYRTFAWYPYAGQCGAGHYRCRGATACPAPHKSCILTSPAGQTIRNEIARDLMQHGIRENATAPDFLVDYHMVLTQRIEGYGGLWTGTWGTGFGIYGGPSYLDEYTEGTIVVEFIDPHTGLTVWRGTAKRVVSNPENVQPEKVAADVDRIIDHYYDTASSEASR